MTRHWCYNIITLEELESSIPVSSSRACGERDRLELFFFLAGIQIGKEKKAARNWSDAPTFCGCFTWFSWVSLSLLISPSVPPQFPNFSRYIFLFPIISIRQTITSRIKNGRQEHLLRWCAGGLWPHPLNSHWVPAISSRLALDKRSCLSIRSVWQLPCLAGDGWCIWRG